MLIVDSQAVKNTCNASVESKGFCHYKCTNGIKRHLAVDTLGLPFFTHCTKASVSDDQGLIELLSRNLNYFRVKPVNIAKITILLDHGYHPDIIRKALQATLNFHFWQQRLLYLTLSLNLTALIQQRLLI